MWWIVMGIGMLFLLSFAYAAVSGAPWVPTWKRDIDRLERVLALHSGEHFVELGCGDGRVVLELTKRSGALGIGVELSLMQFIAAQVRRMWQRTPNAYILLQNIFSHDLSNANAVYLFLMPETYEKLRPKFEKELRPGTRVVSYVWPIPGWEPAYVDKLEGAPNLYLYNR